MFRSTQIKEKPGALHQNQIPDLWSKKQHASLSPFLCSSSPVLLKCAGEVYVVIIWQLEFHKFHVETKQWLFLLVS